MAVRHGQINVAVHHVLYQHLRGGPFTGLDAHVDALLAQCFQGVHEGAVRRHHHGAPRQFLDRFKRLVIGVADNLFVNLEVAIEKRQPSASRRSVMVMAPAITSPAPVCKALNICEALSRTTMRTRRSCCLAKWRIRS